MLQSFGCTVLAGCLRRTWWCSDHFFFLFLVFFRLLSQQSEGLSIDCPTPLPPGELVWYLLRSFSAGVALPLLSLSRRLVCRVLHTLELWLQHSSGVSPSRFFKLTSDPRDKNSLWSTQENLFRTSGPLQVSPGRYCNAL